MSRTIDVDELIREALEAEDMEGLEHLADAGLPERILDMFRGRVRLYVLLFFPMILVSTALAILCLVRFLSTSDVPTMLRWGGGFLFCTIVALNGKNWYWLQADRIAMSRQIKRVELLVAHLAADRQPR